MFIDNTKIIVKGGNGGDGCMSFRREKFVPRGGPDGGDGGHGGDLYFQANPQLKTLLDFIRRPKYEAERGFDGRGRKMAGRAGEDRILEVPCGTIITEGNEIVADLCEVGKPILICKGGEGGRGNVHFKSSVRQAPRIAERGEPGEERHLHCKLKIIADVGLIGMPNSGKSTLLSRLTHANPKIGNYPFTTLIPNLGVAFYQDREIVFADIPGLIEGSHTGKGLGYEFLQHIERTRILVHLVDPLGFDNKSPKENIKIIKKELKEYSHRLADKIEILVINKQDLTGADRVLKEVQRATKGKRILAISGVSGKGITELLRVVVKALDCEPFQEPKVEEKSFHIPLMPEFWVERNNDQYVVRGKKVERLVVMTNFSLPEAIERTQYIMKKMGVERALMSQGAVEGDPIKIASIEFTFQPMKNEHRFARKKYQVNY